MKTKNNLDRDISYHYELACTLSIVKVEELARKILRGHKNLDEFIIAKGGWMYTDKNGNDIDDKPYMRELSEFIDEWDNYLKITGNPMRFTADGPVVTNW